MWRLKLLEYLTAGIQTQKGCFKSEIDARWGGGQLVESLAIFRRSAASAAPSTRVSTVPEMARRALTTDTELIDLIS